MTTMICNNCGRAGIYWKNLGGLSPWTFCPNCNSAQNPIPEEPEPEEEEGPESGIANAKNIGVPDEQDLPAALRDGDIRPQDYNAPLSTPGVISPAEVPLEAVLPKAVEEAMVELLGIANLYEGTRLGNQVAAIRAVIRAALTKP